MNEALSGLLGAVLGAGIALLGTMLTNKLGYKNLFAEVVSKNRMDWINNLVSVIIGLIVIAAGILIWRFIEYLKAKEESHKKEIEHKAYQKYIFMLEENNLSSINIVTKKGGEETSNITIKKNK